MWVSLSLCSHLLSFDCCQCHPQLRGLVTTRSGGVPPALDFCLTVNGFRQGGFEHMFDFRSLEALQTFKMRSFFSDVWKLDFRHFSIHCDGYYGNVKGKFASSMCSFWIKCGCDVHLNCFTAGLRNTFLDVDESLRHVGIHRVLLHLLLVLWRHHLVLCGYLSSSAHPVFYFN